MAKLVHDSPGEVGNTATPTGPLDWVIGGLERAGKIAKALGEIAAAVTVTTGAVVTIKGHYDTLRSNPTRPDAE